MRGRSAVLRCFRSLSFALGNYPTLCMYRRGYTRTVRLASAGTDDRLPVCSQLVLNNLRHWAAHLNNLPDDLLLPIVQVHRAGVEPCSQGVVLWNFGARSY